GCRIRRHHRLPTGPASVALAVCAGDLAPSHGVSWHAGGAGPVESPHRAAALAVGPGGRRASDRGECGGGDVAEARLAARAAAHRRPSSMAGPLRRGARHTGPRLARSTTGPRGLAVVRTGSGRYAADQVFLRQPAGDGLSEAIGPARASTLGDRVAVPRTQDR